MVRINSLLFAPIKLYLKAKFWTIKIKLAKCGQNSVIIDPMKVYGAENIRIYDNVKIGSKCYLGAVSLTGKSSNLTVEDNATIGVFCHIYATEEIIIKKNALLANFVYISDNLHCFENINIPIQQQPIKQLSRVVIGEGCWIGEHVSIIGSSVGKNSVIGANSVVTHDIPDFCVAVGAPAIIIKRYNFSTCRWEKTDKKGNFIK